MMFITGLIVGTFFGVFVMCLMAMAKDPFESACTQDCNQGRNCSCANGIGEKK